MATRSNTNVDRTPGPQKHIAISPDKSITVSIFSSQVYLHFKDNRRFKSISYSVPEYKQLLVKLGKVSQIVKSGQKYIKSLEQHSGWEDETTNVCVRPEIKQPPIQPSFHPQVEHMQVEQMQQECDFPDEINYQW